MARRNKQPEGHGAVIPTNTDNPDTLNTAKHETDHSKFCQTCMGKGVNTAVSETELCKDCDGSGMIRV